MPAANRRIKDLIDNTTNGKVLPFLNLLNEAREKEKISHQRLNRLFSVDTRTGKWPGVPHEIFEAILLKFSGIDAFWLITGQEKSGTETMPDQNLLTQMKNEVTKMEQSLTSFRINLGKLFASASPSFGPEINEDSKGMVITEGKTHQTDTH